MDIRKYSSNIIMDIRKYSSNIIMDSYNQGYNRYIVVKLWNG